jgi:hypothetical protein
MRILSWTMIAACSGGSTTGEPPGAEDAADAADADVDADADGDADSDADSDADPGSCQSWLVTYDLTGSVFFIEAQADFEIVLQEPYSDDHNMGPGSIVLRMSDDGGAPGAGPAAVTEYLMDWNFVVGAAGIADVATDILTTGGPEECGLVSGTLAGTDLEWSADTFGDICQNGEISCSGPLCGQFGSPPSDEPEVIADECGPQNIRAFTFSPDLSTFDMAVVSITDDGDQQTALNFHGTQVSAVLDPNPPACACP